MCQAVRPVATISLINSCQPAECRPLTSTGRPEPPNSFRASITGEKNRTNLGPPMCCLRMTMKLMMPTDELQVPPQQLT